jgi:hypothetical protein
MGLAEAMATTNTKKMVKTDANFMIVIFFKKKKKIKSAEII